MSRLQAILAGLAGGAALASLGLALLYGGAPILFVVFAAIGALTLLRFAVPVSLWVDGAIAVLGAVAMILALPAYDIEPPFFWLGLVATWAFAWLFVERLSQAIRRREVPGSAVAWLIPVAFGLILLLGWEVVTRGANVPQVLLPAPSQIGARLAASLPILWADFQQTFLKAVLAGYCSAAARASSSPSSSTARASSNAGCCPSATSSRRCRSSASRRSW